MGTIWPLKLSDKGPYKKPPLCEGCPLFGNGYGFGWPSLNHGGGNGVLLVGEALGEVEVLKGSFFEGPAGWQLNHVFKRGGFKREEFTGIDNVLHCRPPNNKLDWRGPAQEAIRHCSPFLDDTIRSLAPKAIVALGGTALQRLTGQSGILRNRGFIHDSPYGIPVVGTFHPSYLLPRKKEKSSAKYTWVVIMDVRKALRVAQGKRDLYPQSYLLDPTVDRAEQFIGEWLRAEGDDIWMAWDLETLYKLKNKNEQKLKLESKQTITRISFAWKPGYAMSIPWEPNYIERVVKPIFTTNRPKVGWNNRGFDEPIIIFQEGMELNGDRHDGMDMFHTFQPNIERNLEFATSILADHLQPWKHKSLSEPEWYSAEDSDATITDAYRLRDIMRGKEIPSYEDIPFAQTGLLEDVAT